MTDNWEAQEIGSLRAHIERIEKELKEVRTERDELKRVLFRPRDPVLLRPIDKMFGEI